MKFILILILSNGHSVTAEFDSADTCKAAAQTIVEEFRVTRPAAYVVTMGCHKK